jgi:hypothetical protein
MLTKAKKILITTETHEIVVARRYAPRTTHGFCLECGSTLVSLEEAVLLASASSRAIHRQMERRAVHFAETSDGLVLLCKASLIEHSSKKSILELTDGQ